MNQQQLAALRRILDIRFSEGELQSLCFDLGVSYDDLSGESKSDKARELVGFCHRRDKVQDLVDVLTHNRPDIQLDQDFALATASLPSASRSQDPRDNDIEAHANMESTRLRHVLSVHKHNLYRLREKQAKFGPLHVPVYILNEIDEELDAIEQIETALRSIIPGGKL